MVTDITITGTTMVTTMGMGMTTTIMTMATRMHPTLTRTIRWDHAR